MMGMVVQLTEPDTASRSGPSDPATVHQTHNTTCCSVSAFSTLTRGCRNQWFGFVITSWLMVVMVARYITKPRHWLFVQNHGSDM